LTIVPSTIISLVTTPDAIVVALPTEVTLPVRFAFVVTVDALPVKAPTNAVEVTEVKPANAVCVEPNEIPVVPIVNILPLIDAPFTCIELEIIPSPLALNNFDSDPKGPAIQ
jgi:hypothetical protein